VLLFLKEFPMRFMLFVFALVLSSSLAARGADTRDTIDGTWLPEKAELAGKPFPEAYRKTMKLVVKDGKYTVTLGKTTDIGTVKLKASSKPKEIDIVGTEGPNKGKTILAIYERDGDTLRICYDLSGKSRPKEFKTKEETQLFLVTYKRQKP
jgi:uncharacterized protein (TIGR03067 family)